MYASPRLRVMTLTLSALTLAISGCVVAPDQQYAQPQAQPQQVQAAQPSWRAVTPQYQAQPEYQVQPQYQAQPQYQQPTYPAQTYGYASEVPPMEYVVGGAPVYYNVDPGVAYYPVFVDTPGSCNCVMPIRYDNGIWFALGGAMIARGLFNFHRPHEESRQAWLRSNGVVQGHAPVRGEFVRDGNRYRPVAPQGTVHAQPIRQRPQTQQPAAVVTPTVAPTVLPAARPQVIAPVAAPAAVPSVRSQVIAPVVTPAPVVAAPAVAQPTRVYPRNPQYPVQATPPAAVVAAPAVAPTPAAVPTGLPGRQWRSGQQVQSQSTPATTVTPTAQPVQAQTPAQRPNRSVEDRLRAIQQRDPSCTMDRLMQNQCR